MCIIAYCKTRKMTTDEAVNCWNANDDGAGIAWIENGEVKMRKGFMCLEDFMRFYATVDVLPHVVHFRIGTSGGNVPELTHPFLIDKDSPLDLEYHGDGGVLFHNGVLSSWKEMARDYYLRTLSRTPDGPFSDTRALAVVLNTIGVNALRFVDGRYVVVTPKGFEYWGDFNEEDGILFSGHSFRYSSTKKGAYEKTKEGYWQIGEMCYLTEEGDLLEACPEVLQEREAEDHREAALVRERERQENKALTERVPVHKGTAPELPDQRAKICIQDLEASPSLEDYSGWY
jgi:hypothetical protein